jgi:hypothetical protein
MIAFALKSLPRKKRAIVLEASKVKAHPFHLFGNPASISIRKICLKNLLG